MIQKIAVAYFPTEFLANMFSCWQKRKKGMITVFQTSIDAV